MAFPAVGLDFVVHAQKATKGLKDLNKSVKKVGEQVSTTRLAFAGIVSQAAIGTFQAATRVISNGIMSIVTKSIELEKIKTQFEVLTGSVENAAIMLKDLQQFAATTPFQLPGLSNTASQLLAFGFEQDQIINKLQILGDVAAAANKPIGEIGLIFGQVAAAGKLTGERLLQLQERGIPIGPALAKTMGVAETAVKDLVSKGVVRFDIFEKAMESMNKKGGFAFQGMVKQSKTLGGVLSTLGDNFDLLQTDIGEALLPTLKEVALAVINFIQVNKKLIVSMATSIINKFKNALEGVISIVRSIYTLINDNIGVFKALAVGITTAAASLGIMSISFTSLAVSATAAWVAITGPIGLAVIGIGAVTAAIYGLWSAVDKETKPKTLANLRQELKETEKQLIAVKAGWETEFGDTIVNDADVQKVQARLDQIKESIINYNMDEAIIKEEARLQATELDALHADEKFQLLMGRIGEENALIIQAKMNLGISQQKIDQDILTYEAAYNKQKRTIAAKVQKDKVKLTEKESAEQIKNKKLVDTQMIALENSKNQMILSSSFGLASEMVSLSNASAKNQFIIQKTLAIAQATIAAYMASSLALANPPGPPWTVPIAAATFTKGMVNVGMIAATGLITGAMKFANGGFIPGTSYSGDNVMAGVNSGEAVLNSTQQRNFMDMANGSGGNNGELLNAIINLGNRIANLEIVIQADDHEIGRSVNRAVTDGLILTTG